MEIRSYEALLDDLSGICGIVRGYYDIFGRKHTASPETRKAILSAMGMKVDSAADLEKEYHERLWKQWKEFVPPVTVISVNQPLNISVHVPAPEGEEKNFTLSWEVTDEQGRTTGTTLMGDAVAVHESRWIDGIRYIRTSLADDARRDIGYYTLTVQCLHPRPVFPDGRDRIGKTVRVIITPDACFIPPDLCEGRTWGLSVNLYAIRSAVNWGVGDFRDLKVIVRWIADLKGGFVGINPLHALPNTRPFGISPYSPVSRLYRNFIYLDVEAVPDVADSGDARAMMTSGIFRRELGALRKGALVDYEKVAALKEEVLQKAYDHFYEQQYKSDTRRGREFRRYCEEEGEDLESFGTYMALAEKFGVPEPGGRGHTGRRPLLNWREWPVEYRDPSGIAVLEFRRTGKKEILYFEYLQWLIDGQLKEIGGEVCDTRMPLGLYYDLAVGSVGGGSDAWRYQHVIAEDVDLGAPPDDFNMEGQNWGFPPSIPERLNETGYELFIQTIRKNMRHGGALRIDHALGMFRLFWIPRGMEPHEGAYVACASEDLLRIIALESVRNSTMVIAEDLGTIGENARETLQRFGMLSYRLFYFERNYPDPSFLPPEKYPRMALCAVTTHDLPTVYGFWAGRDLDVKKRLGLIRDESQWQELVQARERDKKLILSALKSHRLIPEEYPEGGGMSPDLCLAIYRYLAMTPCTLALTSLDDIIGTPDQQNMPGTVEECPNWLQKTPVFLEEIISDRRFIELSFLFDKERGSRQKITPLPRAEGTGA